MTQSILRTVLAALAAGAAGYAAEIPAGSSFVVELRDTLEAKKLKRGKSFEAITVEALRSPGGAVVEAGRRLKGRVSHADPSRLEIGRAHV